MEWGGKVDWGMGTLSPLGYGNGNCEGWRYKGLMIWGYVMRYLEVRGLREVIDALVGI